MWQIRKIRINNYLTARNYFNPRNFLSSRNNYARKPLYIETSNAHIIIFDSPEIRPNRMKDVEHDIRESIVTS